MNVWKPKPSPGQGPFHLSAMPLVIYSIDQLPEIFLDVLNFLES